MGVDGYVSFEKPWFSTVAEEFPHRSPGFSLFQTDLIFTEATDSHFSFGNYTEVDTEIMTHARFELEQFGKVKDFYPNHVITVTWRKARKKKDFGTVRFLSIIEKCFVSLECVCNLLYAFIAHSKSRTRFLKNQKKKSREIHKQIKRSVKNQ